jgi:hypothetical protein
MFDDRLKACEQLEKAEAKYMRVITKTWRAHLKEEKKKAKALEKSGGDPEAKRTETKRSDEYPLAEITPVRASLLNQPLPPTPRHSGTVPTNKSGQLVRDGNGNGISRPSAMMGSECQQAMDMVPRPTHRLGWVPFFGQKVDTIDWCKVCWFPLIFT